MRVIFGLGNPGKKYEDSRHNLGFKVINKLSQIHRINLNTCKFQALLGEGEIGRERVVLAKPLIFVNEAGRSLSQIKGEYRIDPVNIIIISDDVDLTLGKLRIAGKGGDGGHKGLRSIIQSLQTEKIPRLRVGIGRPIQNMELKEYVLGQFTPQEKEIIEVAIKRAAQAIEIMITQGMQKAMNEFN